MKDIKCVKMAGSHYSLRRERDGSGDSGMMFKSLDDNYKMVGENGEIHLGCSIMCGSFYARTMQSQDWWLTTPVTAFLEISEDKKMVKFKTGNSIYIAKVH